MTQDNTIPISTENTLAPAPQLFSQSQAVNCYAEVILPLALPTTYTYSVPVQFQTKLQPGCRVEVVLGKHKRYAGIVKTVHTEPPVHPTKDIVNVLDDEPM